MIPPDLPDKYPQTQAHQMQISFTKYHRWRENVILPQASAAELSSPPMELTLGISYQDRPLQMAVVEKKEQH
jgi:hypothetical protein